MLGSKKQHDISEAFITLESIFKILASQVEFTAEKLEVYSKEGFKALEVIKSLRESEDSNE